MTDVDVRAVDSLIDDFGTALHARDLEHSMSQLDGDTGLTVIPSEGVEVHRGPAAVRSFLSRIYGGPRRYGWNLTNRTIGVDGDTAWFTAVGDETLEEAGSMKTIPYCLTGVAIRTADGWRFRLLHASEDSAS